MFRKLFTSVALGFFVSQRIFHIHFLFAPMVKAVATVGVARLGKCLANYSFGVYLCETRLHSAARDF